MVESPVGYLCSVLIVLKDAESRYAVFDSSARFSSVPEPHRTLLIDGLAQLKDTTADLGVDACEDRIERLERRVAADIAISTVRTELRVLLEVVEDQLKRRFFLHIPTARAEYYAEPEKIFKSAWVHFPDAQFDMYEASCCYAVARHSASVFHCMNILQEGLYSLARHLSVEFKFPIELANWNQVIVEIENKIKQELERLGREERSSERERQLTFLGNIGMQFRYFKDAWRNHVDHGRERYDDHQAHTVLTHTILISWYFLRTLAYQRSSESPNEPLRNRLGCRASAGVHAGQYPCV